MRIFFTLFLAIVFSQPFYGQVGVGTLTPAASAQLDVTATNKGFLPPRMTTFQRDGIVSPTPGLMIFNIDTQGLEIYTIYGWFGIQLQLPSRKLIGGSQFEELGCFQQTSDGGFIMAVTSASSMNGDVTHTIHAGTGSSDYWIVKMDANRKIIWNKLLGGDWGEIASSIVQTSDGGYIVAGTTYSSASGDVTASSNGLANYWIVKLDNIGRIDWERSIGGSGTDIAKSIIQTSDGGYLVAGSSNSSASGNVTETTHGGIDYWVVKLDAVGAITWNKLFGGTGDDEAYEVTRTNDDNLIIAGSSSSSASGNVTQINHGGPQPYDFWIVKINSTGTILWNKLMGGNGEERPFSIQAIVDDGYIIAGRASSSNGDVSGNNHGAGISTPDCWIVKLDRFGDITWNKSLGGANNEVAYNIRQTQDGGYIFTGYTSGSLDGDVSGGNHGQQDYWIVKLDPSGNISWNQTVGGSEIDIAFCIRQIPDGGYIAAGISFSSFSGDVTSGNHGDKDIWFVKLGSNGILY